MTEPVRNSSETEEKTSGKMEPAAEIPGADHPRKRRRIWLRFASAALAIAALIIGMPVMFVTISTVSLATIPRPNMTEATSFYTLARRVGGNIGYALVATMVAYNDVSWFFNYPICLYAIFPTTFNREMGIL